MFIEIVAAVAVERASSVAFVVDKVVAELLDPSLAFGFVAVA